MDKNFNKIITAFIITTLMLPIIINFATLWIDFIPAVGDDAIMFQSLISYFGGAIGGIATLIAIYYTVLKVKIDNKPRLYFHYNKKHLYFSKAGLPRVYGNTYIDDDREIFWLENSLIFEVHNIGLNPAVEVEAKITNMVKFEETLKLLKLDENEILKISKSFTKEDQQLFGIGMIKQNEMVPIRETFWFDSFTSRLIYLHNKNIIEDKHENNNHFIDGKFNLFDIQIDYSDILGNKYTDKYSVCVRLSDILQVTTRLVEYEPWIVTFLFEIKK